jgi:glycosyltransferase involved in cell wall biosynthesis
MILSISIPTYNRKDDLKTCLESIAEAWKPEFDRTVEIVVSSNASTDGTDELVRNFKIGGIPIRYHNCEENIGGPKNFLRAVELSSGRCCWLLSDDDAIEPTSLEVIIPLLIANPELPGVLLEYTPWNSDMTTAIKQRLTSTSPPARLPLLSRKDIRKFVHDTGFISACIVNREYWLGETKTVPLDQAGAFPQMWIQCAMMRASGFWYHIPEPMVRFRMDRDSFLAESGATKRALMAVDSYGLLSRHYSEISPKISYCALDLCCSSTAHYTVLMKRDWGGRARNSQYLKLLMRCVRYRGWRNIQFYRRTLPAFILPRPLIQWIDILRHKTT